MSNENIKRFVDTFPFSFVDDAEFESKHKRGKNGQFATQEAESTEKQSEQSSSEEKKEELTEEEKKKIFQQQENAKFIANLDSVVNKYQKQVRKTPINALDRLVEKCAKESRGVYYANLYDIGECQVVIGKDFVKESKKFFHVQGYRYGSGEKRQIAHRQLEGIRQIPNLIDNGKDHAKWSPSQHHPDWEILTKFARIPYKGKNPFFALDICREKADPKGRPPRAYNVTSEKNPNFDIKQKKVPIKDSAPVVFISRVWWV